MVELWLRGIMAIVFAVSLAVGIYRISKGESRLRENVGEREKKYPRYRPYLVSYLLPMFMALMAVMWSLQKNYHLLQEAMFLLLGTFLHISVYYAVLMLLLPWLRKRFSARVCAVLWIIPNYLYIFITLPIGVSKPWLVIPLPVISRELLGAIWLAGFAAVLIGKTIAHLRFRKWVLETAEPVQDVTMLRLWGDAQVRARIVKEGDPRRRYIPLVQSDRVSTPLAVGLMRGSIHMVMPKRSYSEEELAMIFQHEVIHIGREDSWTKFFLVFCSAMCWFNPLMWLAVKRCAEDVELSCDETVLLGAEEGKKRQYAQLLIKTAGDDRGFTTCLSATGQSMRYRLGQVMDGTVRKMGLVLAAGAAFLLFMSYGVLAFSVYENTAADVIFDQEPMATLTYAQWNLAPEENVDVQAVDQEALLEYLSRLQVYRLTGEYRTEDSAHVLFLDFDDPEIWVTLKDDRIIVCPISQYRQGTARLEEVYYLTEPVDWSVLEVILNQQ